jgi:hypothetical protein
MINNDDKNEFKSLANLSSSPASTSALNQLELIQPPTSIGASSGLFELSEPFKSIHSKSNSDNLNSASTRPSLINSDSLKLFKKINSVSCTSGLFEFNKPNEYKSSSNKNKSNLNKPPNSRANESTPPNSIFASQSSANIITQSQHQTVEHQQRNHVVVVEQAPFSVFKSFKSQEQIEKVICL